MSTAAIDGPFYACRERNATLRELEAGGSGALRKQLHAN
jgi:hypothetical protein